MNEILSIIEDPRNKRKGSIETAIQLWEIGVLSALLHSSECWFEIKAKDIIRLNKLQECFYRVILKTPHTCPTTALYWFSGGLYPKHHIMIRTACFLFHVFHLDSIVTSSAQLGLAQRSSALKFSLLSD